MKKIIKSTFFTLIFLITSAVIIFSFRAVFAKKIDLNTYSSGADSETYLSLPFSGTNFKASSYVAYGLGRYYLKGRTAATVVTAYQSLELSHPQYHYIYAEMGQKGGGRFRPHRTHREGLSADFITPVYRSNESGKKELTALPTHTFNLWGYGIRLNKLGEYKYYRIDTTALIAHIAALQVAGKKYGLRIQRVILDPALLKLLRADATFSTIKEVSFMQGQAWFPHDGHYHIDFQAIQ